LFHADTLSGSKDRHVEALLSNILCAHPFEDPWNKLSSNDMVSQEQLIVISGGQENVQLSLKPEGLQFSHTGPLPPTSKYNLTLTHSAYYISAPTFLKISSSRGQ